MLILDKIVKDYNVGQDEKVNALKGISLVFGESGFVSILGQSGCGKTTLLNIIGGLDKYTSGDLIIDGVSTSSYKDKDWDLYRNNKIGFVFQSYNLIPHLTVLENVEIPLVLNGESNQERKKKALAALEKVGLKDLYKKKPNQLSGGQMQRVAIARSLVNDPEIILADEPTGALDLKTSKIVMEILKEISKTKLVIMVTHNEKLAEEYSTRIISMSDGEILGDTQPLESENNSNYKEISGKTSMNYFTSLKLALKNILTKKGRVAMISVASSFGVIGVGLVLALSNGFNGYIQRVEEATASNAPISISATSISYSQNLEKPNYDKFPKDDKVNIFDQEKESPVAEKIHKNNFTNEFLSYLDDIENSEKYKGTVSAKLVNYTNPTYALVGKSKDGTSYKFINNNAKIKGMHSQMAGITGLPNSVFHELYGNEEHIRKSYDVIAGDYPRNDIYQDQDKDCFDIALIVDQYNRINKTTLIDLGLIKQENKESSFTFDEILGTTYKLYLNDEIYYFNNENPDDLYDTATYKDVEAQPMFETSAGTINFPKHREVQYMNYGSSQKALSELYNETFSYKKNGEPYKAKAINLRISGILRVNEKSLTDYMPTALAYTEGLKEYINEHNKNSNIAQNIKENIRPDLKGIKIFTDYIQGLDLEKQNDSKEFVNLFNRCFATFLPFVNLKYNDDGSFSGDISTSYYVGGYGNSLKTAIGLGSSFDLHPKLKAILEDPNLDLKTEEGQKDLISKLLVFFISNPEEQIPTINYISSIINTTSMIESIVLFPTSLNSKALVKEYLDKYNVGKEDVDQIVYSDLIGQFTDGIGQMINIISIVLVVFASISLVVSCVMTGIITYNSVLERVKEIGVLRSVGARKKDVGRLFESESIIIGLISGVIGVVMTYILSLPINAIINSIYPEYNIGNIALLSAVAAIVLIIISGVLAFVSGIIPARSAARKDPVIALRSE